MDNNDSLWEEVAPGGGLWCLVDTIPLVKDRVDMLARLVRGVPELSGVNLCGLLLSSS